jgi:ubiquinone/menaquinone biosynthesis C-methylase UbiE
MKEKAGRPEPSEETVARYERPDQVLLQNSLATEQDAYYSAIAEQFEAEWYGSREADEQHAEDLREMTRAVDEFARGELLEIGSGSGHWTMRCVAAGARVTAIEPSETMRSVTRRRLTSAGRTARLMFARSESLPLEDHKFDRCLMAFVLSHLDATTRDTTWREVKRVLRPGGELLMMDDLRETGDDAVVVVRRVVNGTPFRVLKVLYRPKEVADMLERFARIEEMKTLNHTWIIRARMS